MFGIFAYVWGASVANRIRVRFRRLREPRYLIGSLAGIAYLYFAVFRGFGRRPTHPSGQTPFSLIAQLGAPMHFIGAVLLFLFALVAWVWPGPRRAIEFSRPEVQFFFPAPITRRQLVHYRLLRSQVALLFSSVIATLLLRPGSFATGWTLSVGLWVVLITIRLHSMGVALSRASLAQGGSRVAVRRWAPLVIVLGATAVLAAALAKDWPAMAALQRPGDVLEEVQHVLSTGAPAIILWPFAALARLPLSGSAGAFLQALPAALGILLLNYFWVVNADASFEEAAAERAEKNATRKPGRQQARVRAMPTPFTLAPAGRPETAILWKNLILLGRYASLRTLARFVPAVAAIGLAISSSSKRGGVSGFLSIVCLMILGMTILVGPLFARNDLRQDLSRLAVIKMWPLRGASLLIGEMLAPAALLTSLAWLLILAAATLVPGDFGKRVVTLDVFNRISYALAAACLAPALIMVQLVVQNGIAVLFPAWISVGPGRSRGIDAMGQRLLLMAGIWLSLLTALLPAAVVAIPVGLGLFWSTGTMHVVLPVLVATGIILAECWAVTELLGKALDNTDVSATDVSE